MFANFFKRKPKERKIAFIDGDQAIPEVLDAYTKYVANTNTETHIIRAGTNFPKTVTKIKELNKVLLPGYTTGKEIVDKYIGAFIQKSIGEGYTHITVISSDYDFIDIFKMAVVLNPTASNLTFKMIVPQGKGRVAKLPEQIANIEIVKM